jgi:hypothetical protein
MALLCFQGSQSELETDPIDKMRTRPNPPWIDNLGHPTAIRWGVQVYLRDVGSHEVAQTRFGAGVGGSPGFPH